MVKDIEKVMLFNTRAVTKNAFEWAFFWTRSYTRIQNNTFNFFNSRSFLEKNTVTTMVAGVRSFKMAIQDICRPVMRSN